MQSRDFVHWLQGFFELSRATTLDVGQTDLVRKHLALVFLHEIDPSAGDAAHQEKLNAAHAGESAKPSPAPWMHEGPNNPTVYRC